MFRIYVRNYFGYCTQAYSQRTQGTNSVMWSSSFYNDFFEHETFLRHMQKWKKISMKNKT
eukprot:GAHX01004367.1.p1 GENE.GAHX01004367.1~~GAHX01004367.1.p1  ORF type:complete len:60 (-),score=4.34 GAHX01004367.1:112-291(-)